MEDVIEQLRAAGNDVDGALARFMGNSDMYIDFLGKLAEDENHDLLLDSLRAGDVETAFRASHTLKGLFANFGLDDVVKANTPIVETLRGGQLVDPDGSEVAAFEAEYKKVMDIIS